MPDNQLSYCQGRTLQLEHFMSGAPEYTMRTRTAFVKKEEINHSPIIDTLNHLSTSPDAKACHNIADRGLSADTSDAVYQSPKKSRAKESSKHFGVRFRPDLQKWVAEIRVAEWKTVDKKVWLGTFDSEEGAARAVDAARKLLKCKKKRNPNFPCDELAAYSESIPSNLNLTNLRDDSMFKEVTLFVKRKAQDYAAAFCPNKTSITTTDQHNIILPAAQDQFAILQDDSYGTSYGSSTTFGSYTSTQLAVMTSDHNNIGHWNMSPTTYCSTTTSSSAGTSPDDHKDWLYVDSNSCYGYRQGGAEMGALVEGDWMEVTHVDVGGSGGVWEGQVDMVSDGYHVLPDNDQLWLTDVGSDPLLFPHDDEFLADQMTVLDDHQMMNVESQNMQIQSIGDPSLADWMMAQQSFNTNYPSLMSGSMDFSTQVC